jgi:hypothetical protein
MFDTVSETDIANGGSGNITAQSAPLFARRSWAEKLAHPSWLGNLLTKYDLLGSPLSCHEVANLQYGLGFEPTGDEYNQSEAWRVEETADCGADPIPFS